MQAMANHLWQSTVFGAAAWALTLGLRKNRAAVRYWIWLAASLKFLVPLSLLVSAGALVEWHPAPATALAVTRPAVTAAVDRVSAPFDSGRDASPAHRGVGRYVITGVWLAGWVWGAIFWLGCVRRMRALERAATRLPLDLPIPVKSSAARLEPGVFGIFRPVLILPEGITERLTGQQLEGILAHELCHVRRRDNLTGALHMIVEILFWFHPLVWWIRRQLVAERERACDEAAVSRAGNAETYAEGILTVCRFYLESPAPCVSGVTGADLKRRIAEITTGRVGRRLTAAKGLLLAAAALAAVCVPVAIGVVHAQGARLSFDVASVKPVDQPWLETKPTRSGGRIHWTTDLQYVVGYAYRMQPFRIQGPVPGSANIYRFDVATDEKASEDQIRMMFRSLLAERFKMVSHTAEKEVEGYALTVGKGGMKIKETRTEDPAPPLPETFRGGKSSLSDFDGIVAATIPEAGVISIVGRRVTMFQLCESLQRVMETAVWDDTGLKGTYYFEMRYGREDNPTLTDLPTLPEVLQRTMGLKLEKRKGPIEMLVVESIEKVPTEN